jgi:hypothetical protein
MRSKIIFYTSVNSVGVEIWTPFTNTRGESGIKVTDREFIEISKLLPMEPWKLNAQCSSSIIVPSNSISPKESTFLPTFVIP